MRLVPSALAGEVLAASVLFLAAAYTAYTARTWVGAEAELEAGWDGKGETDRAPMEVVSSVFKAALVTSPTTMG